MRTAIKGLNPEAASALGCTIDIKIGQDRFAATFTDGTINIARGESSNPAATLSGSTAAICHFLFGVVPIGQLEADGRLALTGDRQLLQKLPALFSPAKTVTPD